MKQRAMLFTLLLVFSMSAVVFAGGNRHHAWPDSLTTITLEGTVIIDTTYQNSYFLDVDGDGVTDYHLAFGPDWYAPESGAVRPTAGDYITIYGAINEHHTIPVVIVFEINGLLWREPIENWWSHQGWCDSLEVITVTGTIMLDTNYYYVHYYLDIDEDGQADYFLSFGPPWYEPESSATRPLAGEVVTIEGAVKDDYRLIVLKINDLVWREQYGPAPWSGGWIMKNSKHHKRIHCPTDSNSWAQFPAGAMHSSHHHFPDSIYCEFNEVWNDSLPGRPDSVIHGWHFYFSNPDGKCMNKHGEPAHFMQRLQLNFNCGDSSIGLGKSAANNLALKYWDESVNQWIEIEDAIYDDLSQSFIVEPEEVETYYAIFQASTATGIITTENSLPFDFGLEQNYPNPFNPTTSINFKINTKAHVKLTIFNMLGQAVRTLVDEIKPASAYQIVWNGRDNAGNLVPSGTYVYQLKVGDKIQTRRMVFMK